MEKSAGGSLADRNLRLNPHEKTKEIAILGATGQVGTPLTRSLLREGHRVRALVRSRSERNEKLLAEYEEAGAEIRLCPEVDDVSAMARAMEGSETLIASVSATEDVITRLEPIWLQAAVAAGVQRFVPNEFGAHTQNLSYGDGVLFDHKKRLHEKIFESGIGWTFFYNGGIFDYLLPNLRFFEEVTTFGDLDLPIYTHQIEDIGRFAALALTDDRTLNRCVQMDFNHLTQREMLDLVGKFWPEEPLIYKHYSSPYIIKMKSEAGDEVSAKKGAETDQERWGINYVIYVAGKLAAFTDETLRGSELYPDFQCLSPVDALRDPAFFLEAK
ncbi:NmrA family NAD(P)-binding protein [Roseibacillus persicicus]|uniref:NmrA family NAD(P)-binding protein n=1 Tax=Roseibacillus persicicus TaxID=454148 RepID=UPI00398A8529